MIARPKLRRVRPYGKVNLIGLGIAAVVLYGFWWLFQYGPAYLDNLDVKEAADAALAVAQNKGSDDMLRNTILVRTNVKTLGWHREEDEAGNLVRKEGLGLKPENITIDRDDSTGMITLRVEYDREIELKPFDKVEFRRFVVQKSQLLK